MPVFKSRPGGPQKNLLPRRTESASGCWPSGPAATLGTHVRVSDYERMDRIDDSPVGSTGILDPVKQTGSPIQTDFMKIGTVDEPASLGDTPPSSDSGVHSLGEQ